MTVAALIEQYNTERPNQVEDTLKVDMLKMCEQLVVDEVLITHEDAPTEEEIAEHLEDFDYDTELYAQEPYVEFYGHFLDTRIALNNNDTKRYNISSRLYNDSWLVYKNMYNRKHRPLYTRNKLIIHEV